MANEEDSAEGQETCEEEKLAEGPLLTLEDARSCDVMQLSTDKLKSRQIQRTVAKGDPEAGRLLLAKAEPFVSELATDPYGNYIAQKVLEVADDKSFGLCFQKLHCQVLELCQDMHGTRVAQRLVEQAVRRGLVQELEQALPPQEATRLACSMTGFHVVALLLELLPSDAVKPYLERLCRDPIALAFDQWGCCVLKRCFDRSEGDLQQRLVDLLVENAVDLVQDPYGNYIVQHLVTKGPKPNVHVSRVIDALQGKVLDMCMQKFSSNVLEKCLTNSSDADRNKIINEILRGSDQCLPSVAVRKIMFHQFGNYVFQKVIELAKDPQLPLLLEHSRQPVQEMICRAVPEESPNETSDAEALEAGSLRIDYARRLSLKLIKRYPLLLSGMDPASLGPAAAKIVASLGAWYCDPWMGSLENSGYGLWGPWDPSSEGLGYPDWMYSAAQSQASGKKSRSNRRKEVGDQSKSQTQKGQGKAARATPETAAAGGSSEAEFSAETVKIPRVVGYWPHYEVTYDEVPFMDAQQPANGRGGRKKKTKAGRS
eukprot:TRINITY_DN41962_c0_g1_i1.p1 TRINITY_DN41962_c0_g1~~TRINITY_DN41962_c0_g1_i1.p1  ORF type:complete len:560 (+),score=118.92 TRINITY_DN41962_c0_g1_i1:60-1682(+)